MWSFKLYFAYVYYSSVQSLSRVRLFATPWTAAHQASLSITNSRSPLLGKRIRRKLSPFLFLNKDDPQKLVLGNIRWRGFPCDSAGKESACQCRRHKRCEFDPWVGKMPWIPTPVFLTGESHGQRSLVGYSPWGCKESDMTDRLNWTELCP